MIDPVPIIPWVRQESLTQVTHLSPGDLVAMRIATLCLLTLPASLCLSPGVAPVVRTASPVAVAQPLLIRPNLAGGRSSSCIMQRKSKKDVLELEGVVLEALPSATFRVQLDDTEQAGPSSCWLTRGPEEPSLAVL
jgi:hypothetical protein